MIELSVLVLAGGESSRLKVCKQMIDYHGNTLIAQACRRALSVSDNVTVVTGAYRHRVEAEVSKFNVNILYTENWKQGIAVSLAYAVKREFNVDRLLIMYCNQPFIPAEHYKALVEASKKEPKKIIASSVDGRLTIPAVIPHHLFYELTTLEKEETADLIIQDREAEVIAIDCPQAEFSVNTPADMAKLRS
ncbi:nucleotidyltransferase family protein [Pleionea sediminis]|uniref:nucleotidyltransferase family protein n=1 Tax=Pleionea sediminis TaxID=2569479 RepID=UPI001184CE43|nr:nucleotidyltransferase family protein [Pleionea sediminis]